MYDNGRNAEVGEVLKVSDLREKTIVWVRKGDRIATFWVTEVTPRAVFLWAGVSKMGLILSRTGADLEQVTDETGAKMELRKYLGTP